MFQQQQHQGGTHFPIVQGVAVGGSAAPPPQQSGGGGFASLFGGGNKSSQAQQQQQQQPYYAGSQQPYFQQPSPAAQAAASSNFLGYTPQEPGSFNGHKGTVQPSGQYKDVAWAILFVIHLVIMILVMFSMLQFGGNNNNAGNAAGSASLFSCAVTTGIAAIALSTVALGFMMSHAAILIQVSLVFSVISSLVMALVGLVMGQLWLTLVGLISAAVGACYAYLVWGRIPFAAANLKTAIAAIRANLGGLALMAYFMLALAVGWSIYWSLSCGKALASTSSQFIVFIFLLSYYWVHQVLQNTVHVTTAGVVGTWWMVPSEATSTSCFSCTPAIWDSVRRATTFSFGSICLGSLLVATVQALRALHRMAHNNDDCSIVVCIVDCLLGCLEGLLEYLNQWAYVYIGLYGYNYWDAGRNVLTLFQNKGWSTIITDDLAENALRMVSVVLGLLTGLVGLVYMVTIGNAIAGGSVDGPVLGFAIGFFVGFLCSTILLSLVASAVNTVIVCFAESPAEFERNHPMLSSEMRLAWRQAWPAECGGL